MDGKEATIQLLEALEAAQVAYIVKGEVVVFPRGFSIEA